VSESAAFTERCIAKLQRMSIENGLFAEALHDYLMRHKRIAYDVDRNLFWVKPPTGNPQVAVWMMPVCLAAEKELSER
jgi:hypothetical protein